MSSGGFSNPVVRVAYVIPSNRVAQAQAAERIQLVVKMAQDWYRDQMVRYGYGPRTFRFEAGPDGVTPHVHIVQSSQSDTHFRENVWEHTIEEATAGGLPIWTAGQVWLLIPEAHIQASNGAVTGGVALGASWGSGNDPGVAMMGSDALARFRPEYLTNQAAYAGMIIPEIGPYPLVLGVSFPSGEGTTLSSVSSSVIGALIHEIGHAFGLPHDFRNDDNFRGNIMGNGCRGIRGSFFPQSFSNEYVTLNAAMARVMSLHRYFGNNIDDATKPSLSIQTSGTVSPSGGQITITFNTSDDQSLAYAWLDWKGDTVVDTPLSGTATTTTFRTSHYTAGQTNLYRICVWDHAGNRRDAEVSLLVTAGGSSAPRPKIAVDNVVGYPGRTISLNASSSSIPAGGAGVAYTFIVRGDTNMVIGPSSSATQSLALPDPGRYTVAVRVRDNAGQEVESLPVALINHQPLLYAGGAGREPVIGDEYYGGAARSSAGNEMFVPAARKSSLPGISPLSSHIVLERGESWTNGTLDGWLCSEESGFYEYVTNRMSVVSNSLTITFPPGPGMASPPSPIRLNPTAVTNSFGGRLTGNVAAYGASHLAFDFDAQFPVTLEVRLLRDDYGAEGALFTYEKPVAAGSSRVYIPLEAAGFELYDHFIGKPGFVPPYDEEFAATLENITHIIITINRNGNRSDSPGEVYRIQNIRWTDARIQLNASGAMHDHTTLTNGAIAVTTTIDWSATTDAGWIKLNTSNGSGNGAVGYSLSPNITTNARMATITIAGVDQTTTFTIAQAGAPSAEHLVAWPSMLGFRYELEAISSLVSGWSDAEVIAGLAGDGSVLGQDIHVGPTELYIRLKTHMK